MIGYFPNGTRQPVTLKEHLLEWFFGIRPKPPELVARKHDYSLILTSMVLATNKKR